VNTTPQKTPKRAICELFFLINLLN